jgi:DNA-binding response OmpR family regulator
MKNYKILIIDDDQSTQRIMNINLSARGYTVVSALDGEEGLRLVSQEKPDLIILDIMMPKISGIEVCRQIRKQTQTPIIILSARQGEVDKVECLDAGADDYLTKPYSLRELLSRVKAALRYSHPGKNDVTRPE